MKSSISRRGPQRASIAAGPFWGARARWALPRRWRARCWRARCGRRAPKKGGVLKLGMGGGESTNSLDPALALSQVAFTNLRTIGDTLVHVTPNGEIENRVAEAVESSADAKVWTFKIRQGVEFHNGKTLTPEDVMATLQRHSNEDSQSGALGIMKGIESMQVDGDLVEVTLSTPNADLPFLMADYHLMIQPGGGMDNPRRRRVVRPLQGRVRRTGRAPCVRKVRQLLGQRGRPCRPRRDSGDQRCHRPDGGAAVGPGASGQPDRAARRRSGQARAGCHGAKHGGAVGITCSSCIATPRPSTTTTCGWR